MFYKLITNSSTSGFFVWLTSIQRDATEDVPASAAPRCTSLHSTPPHLTPAKLTTVRLMAFTEKYVSRNCVPLFVLRAGNCR